MYFKGLLFRVGEHIIADVPRSGLVGAERKGRTKTFATAILPYVVTCAIANAHKPGFQITFK